MESLRQDIRHGLRQHARGPAYANLALVVLALGIGANTAIFSVVNAVLLRPLPYPAPAALVLVWGSNPRLQLGFEALPASAADLIDWREQNQVFEHIAAFRAWPFNLTGGGEPERIVGAQVSPELFTVLGVGASLGRTFLPEEGQLGHDHAVLIGHGLWQRRFGAAPALVGKTLTLNAEPYTVVGIMPPGFQFPREADLPPGFQFAAQSELWTPLAFTPRQVRERGSRSLAVIARLKQAMTLGQAQAEMTNIARRLEQQHPRENNGWDVKLVSLHEQMVGRVRLALWVLLGAVGCVLLIACANVANLLLARATTRQKEIAIRSTLGASRWRLIRQMLTESVVLSLLGGTLGLLLARLVITLLVALGPQNIPRLQEVKLDGWVLGFTLLLALLTGIVFGLAPALHATRLNLSESLKEAGPIAPANHNRVRGWLVVSEVAFSLMLLICASLLIKSFVRLSRVDPGFNAHNVLTFEVSLPESKYKAEPQVAAFYQQLIEKIQALPGVQSVGAVSQLPFSGTEELNDFIIEGQTPTHPGEKPLADLRVVNADYYRAAGIPLLAGRYFNQEDTESGPQTVIINQTMARRFWPDGDPLAKRLSLGGTRANDWLSVVGIVGDVQHTALDAEPRPQIYRPFRQSTARNMFLVVRAAADAASSTAAVRSRVWALDKNQPVANIKTMEQRLAEALTARRFSMLSLTLFAALALLLALAGIYGVLSYVVTQRTHEIGVRIALGARPSEILKLVVRQGMTMTLLGLVFGLAAAFGLTRLMSSLLYRVSAADPVIFISAPLLLAGVAFLACYLPARRATKVDPLIALRYE